MEVIFVRSPYFIKVDEASQLGSKVELFIWNNDDTEPIAPTYTLSKKAASTTQTKNNYNISNYIKEYIDIINPVLVSSIDVENNKNWCYVKVKRYTTADIDTYDLLDTITYVALNGHTNYIDGYNNADDVEELVLTSLQDSKKYKYYINNVPYINFFIGVSSNEYQIKLYDLNGVNQEVINIIDTPTEEYLLKLPITNLDNEFFASGNVFKIFKNDDVIFTATFIPEEECKYEPLQCSFINRMGGWEFLTFFKARTQQWEVKNKEYQLLPNDVDYNPLIGESKAFNYEAKQSIKINTGWVEEYYNELIKDLMTSETILLDNKPVKLKTMTTDLKTSLQDKMINYTIEFEYNYNQINNVI
jgi:hypothetical protein